MHRKKWYICRDTSGFLMVCQGFPKSQTSEVERTIYLCREARDWFYLSPNLFPKVKPGECWETEVWPNGISIKRNVGCYWKDGKRIFTRKAKEKTCEKRST